MNTKNLFYTIILIGLLWSCGKDDAPTPAVTKNNAPTISDQSFTVSEDITDGKSIGTVKATDADGDKLTFSISVNDNNLFGISELGVLSLASGKSLDFETAVEHVIKISVSDGTDKKEANITIDVTNVKDSLSEDTNSFITKWEIPYNNFELIIGTNEDYEYDFIIDWGDGSPVEEVTSQNPSHVYGKAGIYFISIQGDFPHIMMRDQPIDIRKTLKGIEQWGSIIWKSFFSAFALCQWMEEYNATDTPNLENVQSMTHAFLYATKFNGDLSEWDVSNVTSLHGTFYNVYKFSSDLSGWDVSNVKNMAYMFYDAHEFNSDLSGWDVSNVTRMDGMFHGTYEFNGDISTWDVSNVTRMEEMFSEATSFNVDIRGWDVSNVTNMSGMFRAAESFNADISIWDVTNAKYMSEMFLNANSFDQNIGAWDIAGVEKMSGMFNDSGMSPENFSETMIGWASNPNLQPYIPIGIEGMSLCGDNQDAIDAMVFRLNIELEWGFSSPPDIVDCSAN